MQLTKPFILYLAKYEFKLKFLFRHDFYQKPDVKGWPTLRNILFLFDNFAKD